MLIKLIHSDMCAQSTLSQDLFLGTHYSLCEYVQAYTRDHQSLLHCSVFMQLWLAYKGRPLTFTTLFWHMEMVDSKKWDTKDGYSSSWKVCYCVECLQRSCNICVFRLKHQSSAHFYLHVSFFHTYCQYYFMLYHFYILLEQQPKQLTLDNFHWGFNVQIMHMGASYF